MESEFPLQEAGLLWGALLGAVAGAVCASLLAGFAVAVLVWVISCLWRRGEPPVLAFCLGLQWVSIVAGCAWQRVDGTYPGLSVVGDVDAAVWLSLLGLLALALGLRAAMLRLAPPRLPAPKTHGERYDVRRLCAYVIALYTINWFVQLNPKILGGAAEIVANLLLTRLVLLVFLLATVLRQRQGYGLAVGAFVYALLPLLGSPMSNFKEFFYLALLALLSQWQPWLRSEAARGWNRKVLVTVSSLALAIVLMGLAWEGSIKPLWRPVATTVADDASPTERLSSFSVVAGTAVRQFDLSDSVASLVARLSSGAGYFSLVLARVPAVLPHEDGELTWRAVLHVLEPRMLFPDKPVLGSDSWLVRTYTGIAAAGDEFGTSIGLGYMAQLYIDFGALGMILALFVYGGYLGALYRIMRSFSPPGDLFGCAAAILFVQHFVSYDGEIAKQVGGLTQTFIVFTLTLHLVGPALLRRLSTMPPVRPGPAWRVRDRQMRATPSPRG